MGDMADYYLEQEDLFERGDTYWPHDMPADNEGPPRQLRPQPTATVWVTREGAAVPVVGMSDLHLINTIRMLQRGQPSTFATSDAAEMAMGTEDYTVTCPTYAAMLREAEKRGLGL